MLQIRIVLLVLVAETLGQDMYLFNPSDSTEREYENIRRNLHRQEGTRGQSFGLEKFLSQSFHLDEPPTDFRPQTFAKPPPSSRGNIRANNLPKKNRERGQTYGLENITPHIFSLDNVPKDSSEINIAEEENFEMKKTNTPRRPPGFEPFALPPEPPKKNKIEPPALTLESLKPQTFDNQMYQEQPPVKRKFRPEAKIRQKKPDPPPVILPEEFHFFPPVDETEVNERKPSRFQSEEEKKPSRFQPEEERKPSRFQPEEETKPPRFQPEEERKPSRFQPEEERKPSRFQPEEERKPSRFQPEEERKPSRFQPEEERKPSRFQPEEERKPSRFQPEEERKPLRRPDIGFHDNHPDITERKPIRKPDTTSQDNQGKLGERKTAKKQGGDFLDNPFAFLALEPEEAESTSVIHSTTEPEPVVISTPRPRKRVMLRRRKKKPQKTEQPTDVPIPTPSEDPSTTSVKNEQISLLNQEDEFRPILNGRFPMDEEARNPIMSQPQEDDIKPFIPIPDFDDTRTPFIPNFEDQFNPFNPNFDDRIPPRSDIEDDVKSPLLSLFDDEEDKPNYPTFGEDIPPPISPKPEEETRKGVERNENEFKLKLEDEFRTKPRQEMRQKGMRPKLENKMRNRHEEPKLEIPPPQNIEFVPSVEEEFKPKQPQEFKPREEFRQKLKRPGERKQEQLTTQAPPPPPTEENTPPPKTVTVSPKVIETEESQEPPKEPESNHLDQPKEIEDRHDEEREDDPKPQPSAHQLKTLLKQQQGTLSLSELLQTQNLSLADFLKGNKGAISALGGKKVQTEEPQIKEEAVTEKRPRLPKISPKSRPFSKPTENQAKLPKLKAEPTENLPKVLDVIEITSEKPTYNGFQPKNPRNRIRLPKTELEKASESQDFSKVPPKIKEPEVRIPITREQSIPEPTKQNEVENSFKRERPRPWNRLTTTTTTSSPKESTTGDTRAGPKRFGEMRPKLRLDRRKPSPTPTTTVETSTEGIAITENNEIVTTEKVVEITEKPIVRFPFMSSNNPELPLIVPNRNRTQWNERKNRDRLGSLRQRTHEKEEKEEPTTEHLDLYSKFKFKNSYKPKNISVDTTTEVHTTRNVEIIEENFDSQKEASIEQTNDQRDEIIELLKSGSSAQRLARILASRNMTLEELIENRERGTPQIDFETLFEEPKQKETTTTTTTTTTTEAYVKKKAEIETFFPNFPEFNGNAKNVKTQNTNEFDDVYAEETYPAKVQVKSSNQDPRDPRYYGGYPKPEIPVSTTEAKTPPAWTTDERTVYKQYPYPSYPNYDNGYPSSNRGIVKSRVTPPETYEEKKFYETPDNTLHENDDVILYETLNKSASATNKNLKNSIDEILKEQNEVHRVKEEYNRMLLPPAVRSAIIASGVVLGIALFVFIAIFVACGCRQRQIRLRGKGSILSDSLSRSNSNLKSTKRNNTLSPISFKRTGMYRKALDFETASSVSNSSNASSYLWNTLKNTFQSRNSTLKNMKNEEIRQENERKREEERRNTLKKEKLIKVEDTERRSTLRRHEEDHGIFTKIDPDRNIINTSLTFKRGGLNSTNAGRFNTCSHLNN